MGYKIAVVGATGNVGREVLTTLSERAFPVDKITALASENSVGRVVSFGEDAELDVQSLSSFDFAGTDIVLSSAGGKVSAEFAPRAAKEGAIDRTHKGHVRPVLAQKVSDCLLYLMLAAMPRTRHVERGATVMTLPKKVCFRIASVQ